ncbi:hypothetical protein OSTOST_20847 [Ostertagia ostertagi]
MKQYTTQEVMDWVNTRKSSLDTYGSLYTGAYEAYKLGKEMLDKETTSSKTIIVTSDGQHSNCKGSSAGDSTYAYPKPWEFDIAKEWRQSGATIIYVVVGGGYYTSNVQEIVGYDDKHILYVKDHNQLNKNIINDVVHLMCTPQFN